MKTKTINTFIILKYVALFFLMLILARAEIYELSPFCYAFFFASIFVGIDEKLSAIFCLCATLINRPSLESLLIAISCIGVGLIMFYIHRLIKRKIHLSCLISCLILSFVTQFYYYHEISSIIIFSTLAVISLFVFINVLHVIILRKNCFKISLDESICFLFTITLIGMGLNDINIFNIEIYRFVIMLLFLYFTAVNHTGLTFAVTLSFALGVSLSHLSLLPIAEFSLLALVSGVFKLPYKLKISFTIIITEIFIQYYFYHQSLDMLYAIIPIAIAILLFIITPKKLFDSLSNFVYVKKSEISTRNLINTTRKNIKKRMSELSNIFFDMKQIHLNMVKKELTKDELIAMLIREVMNSCCKDCIDKNRCTRSLGTENKSNLEYLVEIAVTKGKISLLDLPNNMTSRCGKANYLINTINRLSDEYKQYKSMLGDVNNVKILLADQMGAVSRLLLDIGDEIDSNVSFDIARENKIIDRLLSQNIECSEVLLYTEKSQDASAVLIIKGNIQAEEIEKILSEIMKMPMQITNITPMENGDYNSITLRRKNKYDVVFGLASCNKSGNDECGDCHSIIRLGQDRFLLALCDGMGSGKSAHKMSALTLGLIENFYKAGFDNDIILESVNKLLAINNQENYSTLDVCLIDLNLQIADFIKVGAPLGLIKRDNNIEVIDGGALPIGALDSISPNAKKTTITTKDIIILATDGIVDAFESEEIMIDFVSHLATNNPQTIAESILNEALHLNDMSAKDDMTVLVSRTYLK